MKAQILQGKDIVSIKEQMDSELAAYKLQKAKAFNSLVRWFINDTLDQATVSDSLLALFQGDNTIGSKYNLALLHFDRGELQTGMDVLNVVPNQFGLQGDELTAHLDMVSYYSLKMDLLNQGKSILEVDSLEIYQLLEMEEMQMGMATVYARNVLLALDEIAYDEPILFPDQLKSAQAFEEYKELMNTKLPKKLEVYPNPSKDYVIIKYQLEMEKKGSVIEISNLNGINFQVVDISNKQDQIVVDTQYWKPGIYIATLKINGNSKESIKFTIVK